MFRRAELVAVDGRTSVDGTVVRASSGETDSERLQATIDLLAEDATVTSPVLLSVVGSVALSAVSLRSHVYLDLERCLVGHALSPAVGLADDPTNCLFRADLTLNTSVMDTTLSADAAAGDTTITVANAGTIAAGDWFVLTGINDVAAGGTGIYSTDPPEETQEICKVLSRNGNVLTLTSPIRRWHSGAGSAPVAAKACSAPVQNVRIYGGEFDCTGKVIANGFYLKGARDVWLYDQSAKGFSRAFVEADYGCRGVRVHDLYARGGSNCYLLNQSSYDVSVKNWDFDPHGDRTHPNGFVRAAYRHQGRPVGVRIESCRFGRVACAVEWYGGFDCGMDDNAFVDLDGADRVGRCDIAGQSNRWGVAFSGGATSITDYVAFGGDWDLGVMRANDVKTPTTCCAFYIHDSHRITARKLSCMNEPKIETAVANGQYYQGAIFSDVLNVVIDCIVLTGIRGYALRFENSGAGVRLDNVFLSATTKAQGGVASQFTTNLIYFDDTPAFGPTLINHLDVGDCANLMEFNAATAAPNVNYASRFGIRWSALASIEIPDCRFAKVTSGAGALSVGAIVDADNAMTADETHVKTAAAGGRAGQFIYLKKSDSHATPHIALVAPPRSAGIVLCGTGEVKIGDKLRHDTGGKAVVDAAAAADVIIGVAQSYKASGADGLVRIGP